VPEWPPALDGVVEKLQRGAHVADVGCGHGHSTVLMASAFERSRFVGFDTQDDSLERARAHAEAAAVSERVEFRRGDASSYPSADTTLICFFDCLHDLGDPVGAARHAREALAEDGALMVVEPFAADTLRTTSAPSRVCTTRGRPSSAFRTRGRKRSGSRSARKPVRHASPPCFGRRAFGRSVSPTRRRSTSCSTYAPET
jgi:tRNA A58 N-methylase Trm61